MVRGRTEGVNLPRVPRIRYPGLWVRSGREPLPLACWWYVTTNSPSGPTPWTRHFGLPLADPIRESGPHLAGLLTDALDGDGPLYRLLAEALKRAIDRGEIPLGTVQ